MPDDAHTFDRWLLSLNHHFMVLNFSNPKLYYQHLGSSGLISKTLERGLMQGFQAYDIWTSNSASGTYMRRANENKLFKNSDLYSFVTLDYVKDCISKPHIQRSDSENMLTVKINVYLEKENPARLERISKRDVSEDIEIKNFLWANSPPANMLTDEHIKVKSPGIFHFSLVQLAGETKTSASCKVQFHSKAISSFAKLNINRQHI
ncbi:hypothetical protein HELRODRAFT_177971 [Helobdella robusta]|uniref:Uncharacterized protein n=1 Tax=Helobdella robusta TaxID=6412 RepID=T1FCJ7_HELRO|nr:hypothetical protein HELRODRAFT_177971 [Helobdella robusta]ESN97540.1 hypothetical protein HELRODRAFT_177971 [Helobdella robusta]